MSEPRVWIVYQPKPRSGVVKRHRAQFYQSPFQCHATFCGQYLLSAEVLRDGETMQTKRCKTCFMDELAAEKD